MNRISRPWLVALAATFAMCLVIAFAAWGPSEIWALRPGLDIGGVLGGIIAVVGALAVVHHEDRAEDEARERKAAQALATELSLNLILLIELEASLKALAAADRLDMQRHIQSDHHRTSAMQRRWRGCVREGERLCDREIAWVFLTDHTWIAQLPVTLLESAIPMRSQAIENLVPFSADAPIDRIAAIAGECAERVEHAFEVLGVLLRQLDEFERGRKPVGMTFENLRRHRNERLAHVSSLKALSVEDLMSYIAKQDGQDGHVPSARQSNHDGTST